MRAFVASINDMLYDRNCTNSRTSFISFKYSSAALDSNSNLYIKNANVIGFLDR